MSIKTDDPQRVVNIQLKTGSAGGELLTTTFRFGAFDMIVVAPIPDEGTTSCKGFIKLKSPVDGGMERSAFLQMCQVLGFSERKTSGMSASTTPNQTRADREEVRDDSEDE